MGLHNYHYPCIHTHALSHTAPPKPIPGDLRVVSMCDTSAVLEWDKPEAVGRDDFYYDIMRSAPDTEDLIMLEEKFVNHHSVIRYTVAGLMQTTTYTFSVCVHNGVSDQDEANAKLRVVAQQAKTKQGSMLASVSLAYNINDSTNACRFPPLVITLSCLLY